MQYTKSGARTEGRGFSLLELMVVIAIIGILSAVAAPAYRDYVIKSRVSELANLANPYQQLIVQGYAQGTITPTAPNLGNIPGTTNTCIANVSTYVQNICLGSNGTNTYVQLQANSVALGLPAANANLNLYFAANYNSTSDSIVWKCGGDSANSATNKYLPSSCSVSPPY